MRVTHHTKSSIKLRKKRLESTSKETPEMKKDASFNIAHVRALAKWINLMRKEQQNSFLLYVICNWLKIKIGWLKIKRNTFHQGEFSFQFFDFGFGFEILSLFLSTTSIIQPRPRLTRAVGVCLCSQCDILTVDDLCRQPYPKTRRQKHAYEFNLFCLMNFGLHWIVYKLILI